MNKLLIGLLALSIAGNAFLLLKPKEAMVKELQPEKVVITETETVTLEDKEIKFKYARTKKELEILKEEFAAVQNELKLLNDRIEVANLDKELTVTEIDTSPDSQPTKEYFEKAQKQKKTLESLFQSEEVDSQWAYTYQDKISRVLNARGDTSLYEISQLECKTSVCKLSIKPFRNSEGSRMASGMNAMMSIGKDKELSGYITTLKFGNKDEQETVELYIAKRTEI
ncbi:hypothetical protein [Kangiella sp. TOML190]|uniref:hypothetical protein n=1 Tax=Kangiella sp. TOML190 TaxID=2931351 RepID=UPI002041B503|nr:hypothetical protein [Kangiella sp. TOML190]